MYKGGENHLNEETKIKELETKVKNHLRDIMIYVRKMDQKIDFLNARLSKLEENNKSRT